MIIAESVQGPDAWRDGLLSRHPLIFYSVIAYAGTWLVMLPYVRFANSAGLLPFAWPIPFAVSATIAPFAGPFLAAFIMTDVTEGRPGIGSLLRRISRWRVGLGWYYLPSSVSLRSPYSERSSCRESWHRFNANGLLAAELSR